MKAKNDYSMFNRSSVTLIRVASEQQGGMRKTLTRTDKKQNRRIRTKYGPVFQGAKNGATAVGWSYSLR
jgi:hypothetical protein